MKTENEISKSKIYETFSNLVIHSENVRWNRFNNLLIINSVLILAWATIFSSTKCIPSKEAVLTIICFTGIVIGLLWAWLGKRSCRYLEAFHTEAEILERLEKNYKMPMPFEVSGRLREIARNSISKIATSTTIVIYIPIFFSIIFIFLLIESWNWWIYFKQFYNYLRILCDEFSTKTLVIIMFKILFPLY